MLKFTLKIMKKFKIIITYIITICISVKCLNLTYGRELITSYGTYNVNLYNVAIVGDSHASFMSDLIKIDNDFNSVSVGNHSVGGDDLEARGNGIDITTDWAHGNIPIAKKGELKGWINNFFDDAEKIELAICWFGANNLNGDINYFEEKYRQWIKKVRRKSKVCKLVLMPIPYINLEKKEVYQKNSNVDRYNNVIKKLVEEFKDQNVYFEEHPSNYQYADTAHFDKDTFTNIWNNIKIKYNLNYRLIE